MIDNLKSDEEDIFEDPLFQLSSVDESEHELIDDTSNENDIGACV